MTYTTRRRLVELAVFVLAVSSAGCSKNRANNFIDRPQLSADVSLRDVTFRSKSLDRDMTYRVILPRSIRADEKLPVVYLLHGGGGGFRDWSNYSDVAKFAAQRLILVMPEGNSSYYTNSATVPGDRYEDYIVRDLVADVEARFPAASSRSQRAIAGVSMGGFGAIKIGLKYPELYFLAGGISPAVDVPTRPFSVKRIAQWRFHSSIFGPSGSQTRRENDPYQLAREADPRQTPFLFLRCGEQEGLLAANQNLAAILKQRRFRYDFSTLPGDHDWQQWDRQIPSLFEHILSQLNP